MAAASLSAISEITNDENMLMIAMAVIAVNKAPMRNTIELLIFTNTFSVHS